jgi:hypothetical protein
MITVCVEERSVDRVAGEAVRASDRFQPWARGKTPTRSYRSWRRAHNVRTGSSTEMLRLTIRMESPLLAPSWQIGTRTHIVEEDAGAHRRYALVGFQVGFLEYAT